MTSATGNRTTELREKLTERGIEYTTNDHMGAFETSWNGFTAMQLTPNAKLTMVLTPEQAIAATLGRHKAKSHPYGYERDTGAFNCTRCECGCLNDISARYCNDCGGEIEIDEYAEKEFYEYNRNSVFVIKHDDGTLELGGKKYIAATLGRGECENVGDAMSFACSSCGCDVSGGDEMGHNSSCGEFKFCPNCGKAVKR